MRLARSWWGIADPRPSGMRERPVLVRDLRSLRGSWRSEPSSWRRVRWVLFSERMRPKRVEPSGRVTVWPS